MTRLRLRALQFGTLALALLAVATGGALAQRPRSTWSRGTLTLELTDSSFRASMGAQVGAAGRARVLAGATLIDGTGTPAQPNMSVEVLDGRITAIYPTGSRRATTGVSVLDLRGRWLIPGLIDAHVHLATDPSGTDSRTVVAGKLRAAVRGGVTSVRDMAGDVRSLAELARATRVSDLEGPDIHYSAVWAGADFMRDPRVRASTRGTTAGSEPWMRSVDSRTEWRLAAAEARGSGARGIKLYADASALVVQETVRSAHAAGLKVWAHATLFPARPSELVTAGVDVLSHAPLLAWEATDQLPDYRGRYGAAYDRVSPDAPPITALLQLMKARGTFFEPTMFVFAREGTPRPMAEWATAVTRRAISMGVPIVSGTDGMIGDGADALPNLHRELELLVAAGLTPLAALQAATYNAAKAIGIDGETGAVRPGLSADLVVLSADPLTDIRNTQKIERVLKRGIDVTR